MPIMFVIKYEEAAWSLLLSSSLRTPPGSVEKIPRTEWWFLPHVWEGRVAGCVPSLCPSWDSFSSPVRLGA